MKRLFVVGLALQIVLLSALFVGCARVGNNKNDKTVTTTVGDSEIFIFDGWKYSVNDDKLSCTIVGLTSSDVSDVVIPETIDGLAVTDIGWGAFMRHTELESVKIPESVKTIDEYAFYGCTSLLSIDIPDSVTSLGALAFDSCKNLESVRLGSGLTALPGCAFYCCSSLIDIEIPEGVTTIGEYAFLGCVSLESVSFPSTLKGVATRAFDGCAKIEKVIIADLYSWSQVTFADVTAAPTYYGVELWTNGEQIVDLTLPSGIETIENLVFSGAVGVEHITLPESVKTLAIEAFYNYSSLRSVYIPKGVTTIASYTFYGCDELESVFYGGTAEDWALVELGQVNSWSTGNTLYFYSETKPEWDGYYWHYVNGIPTRW